MAEQTHKSIAGKVLPTGHPPERTPFDKDLQGTPLTRPQPMRSVPSSHGGVREDRANTKSRDTVSNGRYGANSGRR